MSSTITTELVKELRDKTGISVMQCRKALTEADGDMNKALAILKKTSSDIASKKKDRATTDGAVIIKEGEHKAVMLSLHCETDFVSRNEDFTSLLRQLAEGALSSGAEKVKETSKEMIDQVIQKTGENIELGEIAEVSGEVLGSYLHNNKIGVVVSLSGGNKDIAKDIAMHVAAMNPEYITMSDISDDAKRTMAEVFEKEVASSNKPEEIKKKILEGKINTYFKEKTLLEQPFIKNGEETVAQLLGRFNATIKEVKRHSI